MEKENSSPLTSRASGVLLPISSLPGGHGIGDLGPEAHRFVDFLFEARQGYWQTLPVGPTGAGDSPYSSTSAFAGNPRLISLDFLAEDGLIQKSDIPSLESPADAPIFKEKILRQASSKFQKEAPPELWNGFRSFLNEESYWLNDYAWFSSFQERFKNAPWTSWPKNYRARRFRFWERDVLHFLGEASFYHQFVQFIFYRQWERLARACGDKKISLIGDLPLFVAQDSADVWAHQEIFDLSANGRPLAVSGVPPDYFSSTGQLWGNPLYRWDALRESGYDWWRERLKMAEKRFDLVRLDHFIGFERYWKIPGEALTAEEGSWTPGPGADFFSTLLPHLKKLRLIAEDLGVAGEDVYRLRDLFHFPGMNVLQFSFGGEEKFLPKNYAKNSVAYTGTHDNDTLVGWLQGGPEQETRRARDYVKNSNQEIHWALIEAVLNSPSDTVIIPAQDILGLGSEARMNRPGLPRGNWSWRLKSGQLNEAIARRLKGLSLTLEIARIGS